MNIKAHTIASPSHRKLLEEFMLPTFPHRPEISLTIHYIPQYCTTGEYESQGWHKTMEAKARCFYDGVNSLNPGEAFMFVDCDIIHTDDWYEDLVDLSTGYDLVAQNDYGAGLNSGFFLVKRSEATEYLFETILMNLGKFTNEQLALTHYARQTTGPLAELQWNFLPRRYWNFGENVGHWSGAQEFSLPENIQIAHLNWTTSFGLKTTLGEKIKEKLKL